MGFRNNFQLTIISIVLASCVLCDRVLVLGSPLIAFKVDETGTGQNDQICARLTTDSSQSNEINLISISQTKSDNWSQIYGDREYFHGHVVQVTELKENAILRICGKDSTGPDCKTYNKNEKINLVRRK
jgi:hypothetical protein